LEIYFKVSYKGTTNLMVSSNINSEKHFV
jgi:hypothetical protein